MRKSIALVLTGTGVAFFAFMSPPRPAHCRIAVQHTSPTGVPGDCLVPLCAAGMLATDRKKSYGTRGAIYARYSTKMQRSTEDQIRCCREWATENGITVEEKHIFVDEAKTGRSSKRAGLKAMEAALDAGEIDVVIFFSTSRLYRKAYKALQFVEKKIIAKRRRAVFVRQAIDTNDEQFWQVAFQFYSMMDERMAASQAAMVVPATRGLH